jgi:hypothetical protein
MRTMERQRFETILSDLHRVRPEDVNAFRSRLRILHDDAGAPFVSKPGKGARINYADEDVFTTHIALTLDDSGLPPLVIKEIMSAIREQKILRKFADRRSQRSKNLWLKIQVARHNFSGDRHLVSLFLEPLSVQSTFLRAQDGKLRLLQGNTLFFLINLSASHTDCENAISMANER